MKKQTLLLPLILALVVGCSTPISSSSSEHVDSTPTTQPSDSTTTSISNPVTSTPSSDQITTSETPLTSEPTSTSDTPTSQPQTVYTNIREIRFLAYGLQSQVNASNIATSSLAVKVRAQLLSLFDYVAGGNDYTYRNKALVANGDGYILVSMSATHYGLIKDYVSQQQVYDFTGTIGLYNGEPEIVIDMNIRPQYLTDVTLSYVLPTINEPNIAGVFTQLKTMKVNNKGIGYLVSPRLMRLRYVTKLENSIALFTDGTNVVQVYGHDRINNNFSVDLVYQLVLVPGFYYYKTTFTYVNHTSSNEVIPVLEVSKWMTATTLYTYTYVLEPKYASDVTKNLNYAELFINAYRFAGYANYYVTDNQANISFDDSPKDYYTTYTNARDAKSLFINNDNGLKLYTDRDFLNCPYWPEASLDKASKPMVEFVFVPYLLNTNKYFQIQVMENTYMVLAPTI